MFRRFCFAASPQVFWPSVLHTADFCDIRKTLQSELLLISEEKKVKKSRVRTYRLCIATLLAMTALVIPYYSLAGDKLQPEEIVAKHLDSIGSAETRASVHSRIAAGTVVAILRSPGTAKFSGRAVMASDGNKNMIGLGFENADSYQEKFGFDGRDLTVGFVRPGVHGYWGDFLLTHQNIIKDGLVGGTLSDAWPLLNLSEKKAKLEYRGIKKIDGKSLHELKYIPRGSSDLEISLFFDTETFQHVRTEYTRVISAGLGTGVIGSSRPSSASQSGAIDASGQQRPARYKLVEQFSDFKKESGLTLPHTYKVGLDLDTRAGRLIVDWEFTLTEFAFNQPIPAATFNVNTKQ
jgi:hypothetical protein